MKKKLIFEGIFILLVIVICTYLILAGLQTNGIVFSLDPANNTNISIHEGDTVWNYNFTCNFTTPDTYVVNASIWANFNGSFGYNISNSSAIAQLTADANNGSGSFNVSGVAEGTYTWACKGGFANGTIAFSTNRTVIMDFTPPLVQNFSNESGLIWVTNNSGRESAAADWALPTTTVTDTTMITNCTLHANWNGTYGPNVTNSTITSGATFTFTFGVANKSYLNLSINDTGYKFAIKCIDSTNHTRYSSNATLRVDGISPLGNISVTNTTTLASDSMWTNWSDETWNVSAVSFDVGGSNITNCSLYGDFNGSWSRNQTKNVSNFTNFDFTALTLATNTNGHKYNVLCKDKANNRRNLSLGVQIIRIDAGAPTVTLSSSEGNVLSLGQSTTLSCTSLDDVETKITEIDVAGSSLCSGAGACSGTYKMETSVAKSVTCTAEDQFNHTASSSLTLTEIGTGTGGAGGGGGGGAGAVTSTEISTEPTTVTSTQGAGEEIPLTIAGESYNLGIESVGAESTSITLAGQTIDLVVGETAQVDVNGDGTNDVEITLNSIVENKPQFTIREISLAAAGEEVGTLEETTKKPSATKIALIALAIILAIVIIIYIIERRKR